MENTRNQTQLDQKKLEQHIQDLLVRIANERYRKIMDQAQTGGTTVLAAKVWELVLEYAQFIYNSVMEDSRVTVPAETVIDSETSH